MTHPQSFDQPKAKAAKELALLCVNCGWVKPENVVNVPRCPRCTHQHTLVVAELAR